MSHTATQPAAQPRLTAGLVGPGFRQVEVGSLVEKGDQFLTSSDQFQPFPLEAIGRPVTAGCLVRRIEARPAYGGF